MKCIRYFINLYVLYYSLPLFPIFVVIYVRKYTKMIVGPVTLSSWQEYCIKCECYTYNHKVFITKIKSRESFTVNFTVTPYYNSILKNDMVKATCLSS